VSSKIVNVMVGLIALIHGGIAAVEMFFWTKPWAHDRLNELLSSPDVAIKAAPIVFNAGLYNGFIAAGLLWGLSASVERARIQTFFLVCVVVAGIVGSMSLRDWVPVALQSLPAAIALLIVGRSRTSSR
jgi:putative membrane protein